MHHPQAQAPDPQDRDQEDRPLTDFTQGKPASELLAELEAEDGCWCCGETCMFCDGRGGCVPACWCSLCKIASCPACCGCDTCRSRGQGAYSPDDARVSHGGYPVTHEWADIP